jgi:hypothetical protein
MNYNDLWTCGVTHITDKNLVHVEVDIFLSDWLGYKTVKTVKLPVPIRQYIVNKAIELKKKCPIIHIRIHGWENCRIPFGWTNLLVDQLCEKEIFVDSVHYKSPRVMVKLGRKIDNIADQLRSDYNIDELDIPDQVPKEANTLLERLTRFRKRYARLEKSMISKFMKFANLSPKKIKSIIYSASRIPKALE